MINLGRERFEDLVSEALDLIPPQLITLLDNIVVVVEDYAPDDDPKLLGLYEGTPLTDRDSLYMGALPDCITIYRYPILAICSNLPQVIHEVATTVIHEVAHHFGISDDRLHELGWD